MGKKQEINVIFANDLSEELAHIFKIAVFNQHIKQIPEENQEAVINRLIEEGLISNS